MANTSDRGSSKRSLQAPSRASLFESAMERRGDVFGYVGLTCPRHVRNDGVPTSQPCFPGCAVYHARLHLNRKIVSSHDTDVGFLAAHRHPSAYRSFRSLHP